MAGFTSKRTFPWPPIVDKRTCEWCSSPVWIRDQFPSLTTSPWQHWPSDLLLDLQYCLDCVNEYHQIRDDFVAENPDKKKELWSGDVERLSLWMKLALENIQNTSCSTMQVLENLENRSSASLVRTKNHNVEHSLHVPVQEILQFPLLLFDKVLAALFKSAMVYLLDNKSAPNVTQRLSGLYVLLVHPSLKLRKWAERSIKGFNKLTAEDYDDVKQEVQWIVDVATLNMFELAPLLEETTDIFTAPYLAFHLFDLPLDYWKGFLRLLLSMSEQAIRHKLLGVSGHRDLPDTIINVIEAAYGKEKAIFWPAFHCFVIILESCGPHLWLLLSRKPPKVFNIITSHAVYSKALLQYMARSEQSISHSSSTDISDTQEFGLGSQGVPSGSLPKTALTWLQTFVVSVLDFDCVTSQCVSEVIQFLNKYSDNMDVKIKILTMVLTVMRSKHLVPIQSTIYQWVPHVVELATLPETNAETFRSVVVPARELISSLMIKSEIQPGTSPIKNLNFNELTSHARRHGLVKTIIGIFEKTQQRGTLQAHPKVKRNFARKSMRSSLQISKQTQTEQTVKMEEMTEDESHESTRDHYSSAHDIINVELCSEVNSETTAPALQKVSQYLMLPKIQLVDCMKKPTAANSTFIPTTKVSGQKDAGCTKDKPIFLDSDSEEEYHKDFSTFSRRSTEISKDRLRKLHSPNEFSKSPAISPSNMISKLSKSKRDSDDTLSLESNSDDEVFRSTKRPRKKLKVLDDSSDETESLEEEPFSEPHFSSLPKRSSTTASSRNARKLDHLRNRTEASKLTPLHPVSAPSSLLTSEKSCLLESATPSKLSHFKAMSVINRRVKIEPTSTLSLDTASLHSENINTTENKSHDSYETPIKPKTEDFNQFESKSLSVETNTSLNDTNSQNINTGNCRIKQEKYLESGVDCKSNDPSNSTIQSQAHDISFKEELDEISEALSRDLESDIIDAQWVAELDDQSENTTVEKHVPGSSEICVKQEELMGENERIEVDCNQEHYLPLEDIGRDYFGDAEDGDNDVAANTASSSSEEGTITSLSKILDEMKRKYGKLESDSEDEDEILENVETDALMEENDVPASNEERIGSAQTIKQESNDKDNRVDLGQNGDTFDTCDWVVGMKERDVQESSGQLIDNAQKMEQESNAREILVDFVHDDNSLDSIDWQVRMKERDVQESSGQFVDHAQKMEQESNAREILVDFVHDDNSLDSIDWDELNNVEQAIETKSMRDASTSLESNSFRTASTSTMWMEDEPHCLSDSQQESARECVEADIRSESESDDDDDDDVIEIFCCRRSEALSSTLSVRIKVEKPDDIPEVPSEQVQAESSVPRPSAPSTSYLEQPASSHSVDAPSVVAPISSHSVVAALVAAPPIKTTFNTKPADIVPTLKLNPEHLIAQILSWKYMWLNVEDRAQIPMYTAVKNAEKLPKTFDSIDLYYKSFARLLCVETWEQILKDWRDGGSKKGRTESVINSVSFERQFTFIEATSHNIRQHIVDRGLSPKESELVILRADGHESIFGLIDKVEQEVFYRRRSSSSEDGESPAERFFNLTFTIRTRTSLRLKPESNVEIIVVTSLLTTLRQWRAMVNIQRSLLIKDILRPRALTYFCADEKPAQVEGTKHYNQSQVRVIETASRAVSKEFTLPRICLVQGPPGTGKSHTIVGMVDRILNDLGSNSSCQPQSTSQLLPEKPRILICCPSNEGVDELIRKLLRASIRKTYHENVERDKRNRAGGGRYKNCGDFSLVRFGRKSKIHESVKHVSLDNLTRQALADAGHVTDHENTNAIKNQTRQIEKQIDALEKENFMLRKGETLTEQENEKFENLEKEKSRLMTKKQSLDREYRKQRDHAKQRKRMECRIKKEILNNADIVCATLSGSGSTTLLNEMRGTDGKKIPFSCVIVDEACQCCELDILIPLQFRPSKLILVGDPQQLPATVFSADAKRLLYSRSMFERLYKSFNELPRNERPVHLLDVQYRMHPEIAHFPSKYVYNDNIHTDSSLLRRAFPIKTPYVLFNVHGGREINDRKGGICNREEADLVTSLCEHLVPTYVQASDIGIITPYRAQLYELQRFLRKCNHSGGVLKDVEVNTVDGFQGREKNIIVMSCVRSTRHIGFMKELERLNVAITRARHCLFIFGNLDSLEKAGSVWKNMINDAHHRRLIHEVNRIDDVKRAISIASSYHSHGPRTDGHAQTSLPSSSRRSPTHKDNRSPPKTGPSSKGPSTKAAPTDNRPSTKAAPTDNRPSTKAAPKDNGSSTKAAPTNNRPSTRAAPKDNGSSSKAAPKDNGSSSKAAPKDNGSSSKAAPKDNGSSSKAAPKDNGSSSKVSSNENGPFSKALSSENGPSSKAARNGPSSKLGPNDNGACVKVSEPSNIAAKESKVSSNNVDEADCSENKKQELITDEGTKIFTENDLLHRLLQCTQLAGHSSKGQSTSVVSTAPILPCKRKCITGETKSPKKVRFGKAFVLEFGKKSGRCSYSYNIPEPEVESLPSAPDTSSAATMGCTGTPVPSIDSPEPCSAHGKLPETSTVASTSQGITSTNVSDMSTSTSATLLTTHQPCTNRDKCYDTSKAASTSVPTKPASSMTIQQPCTTRETFPTRSTTASTSVNSTPTDARGASPSASSMNTQQPCTTRETFPTRSTTASTSVDSTPTDATSISSSASMMTTYLPPMRSEKFPPRSTTPSTSVDSTPTNGISASCSASLVTPYLPPMRREKYPPSVASTPTNTPPLPPLRREKFPARSTTATCSQLANTSSTATSTAATDCPSTSSGYTPRETPYSSTNTGTTTSTDDAPNGASSRTSVNSGNTELDESISQRSDTQQTRTVISIPATETRLEEVATRVRERNLRQRGPVEISAANYRGGRGGRVRLMPVEDESGTREGRGGLLPVQADNRVTTQPPVELRDWHPYGGPKRRTAQHTSSSVQNLRARGVTNSARENIRPPQKRPSLTKNINHLQKRRKK